MQNVMHNVEALARLREKARQHSDGHYTLFAFTTNYKAMLGTPSDEELLVLLHKIPGFPTMEKAVDWLLDQIELEDLFSSRSV